MSYYEQYSKRTKLHSTADYERYPTSNNTQIQLFGYLGTAQVEKDDVTPNHVIRAEWNDLLCYQTFFTFVYKLDLFDCC